MKAIILPGLLPQSGLSLKYSFKTFQANYSICSIGNLYTISHLFSPKLLYTHNYVSCQTDDALSERVHDSIPNIAVFFPVLVSLDHVHVSLFMFFFYSS